MDIQKEEENLDYINILKAIKELPFEVGKNLLADFVIGSYSNKSISKNQLDELHFFGSLNLDKQKVLDYINKMLKNKIIEEFSPDYNKFVKVLRLTIKGQNEIINPTLNKEKKKYFENIKEISKENELEFEKYIDFLDGYNKEQKQSIISDKKNILTVAGAGTGKTTTLIKRIEFLIRYKKVREENILAITFTRKARQEMIRRLELLNIKNVQIHTFNSFCEKILKENEQKIYGKKMRMMSYTDKFLALNFALDMLGRNIEEVINEYFSSKQKEGKEINQLQNIFLNDCFSIIEYFKITRQEFYDFSKEVEEKEKRNANLLYNIIKLIKKHMEINNLRDYTDQIIDTINFFKKYPQDIPKFEHILIDEYQDVNTQQVLLIKLLSPSNIYAVGDPRQSIFGWRGSDINFILNFEKDFLSSEIINLTKNYRSKSKIVDLMNNSIKEMELPDLEAIFDNDSQIKIFSFENEEAEISFIIEYLKETKEKLNEIFILSRTNKQLNNIANMLRRININFILKTEDSLDVQIKENFLTLATIHAIKGLEANTVFLVGCNNQNFPCRASDHPIIECIKNENYDKDSEELRLFYVAISRAKEKLFITYSGSQTSFITDEMKELIN